MLHTQQVKPLDRENPELQVHWLHNAITLIRFMVDVILAEDHVDVRYEEETWGGTNNRRPDFKLILNNEIIIFIELKFSGLVYKSDSQQNNDYLPNCHYLITFNNFCGDGFVLYMGQLEDFYSDLLSQQQQDSQFSTTATSQ